MNKKTSSANEDISFVFYIQKKVSRLHIEIAEVFLLCQVWLCLLGPPSERLLKVERFEIRGQSLITCSIY